MKKGVLRHFVKFTGKHLCQSLFFNKVAGLRPKEIELFKFSGAERVKTLSKKCVKDIIPETLLKG